MVETDQLVAALCRREQAALAQLYDRYGGAVYALALRMTRDAGAAEEISLDAFMQLWQQADRFNAHHGSLQGWLFTMVRNRAIDRMRAAQAAKRTFVQDAADETRAPQPEEVAELAERRQLVRQAIAQLSAPQRAALELAYYEGLSHSQIAARLDEPLGTVKARLRQAMQVLRKALAPLLARSA